MAGAQGTVRGGRGEARGAAGRAGPSRRGHDQAGTYCRRHGFDDDLYDRSHAVLREAVGDGAHPTRAEVAEHLAAAWIAVSGMDGTADARG